MEAARSGSDALGSRFEGLHAEATAAVGYSVNTMRTVRERYRAAYAEALGHWQSLRDELEAADRAPRDARPRVVDATFDDDAAAGAAEAGAADARLRALRGQVEAGAASSAPTSPRWPSSSSPNMPWSARGCSWDRATEAR